MLGANARLFRELSPGGLERRLRMVDLAGRQLPQPTARRMAILAQQADPALVVDCYHRRPTGMAHHLEVSLVPIGQHHGIDHQIHDRAGKNVLRGYAKTTIRL